MVLLMTVGLVLTVVALAIAGRRLWWLYRLATSGQPAPERIEAVREHPGGDAAVEATQVIGQRKLLQWTVPGVAHALTFWGFTVLLLTIIESYGDLFCPHVRDPGHRPLGVHRVHRGPVRGGGAGRYHHVRDHQAADRPASAIGRESRFSGSHTGAAWLVLAMIFLVVATLLLYRGAQINTGDFPYPHGAFASQIVGHWLRPARHRREQRARDDVHPGLQLAVVLAFLVFITYSKHLHIFLAPVNVLFSRRPNGARARCSRCARTARCSTSRRPTRTPTSSAAARSRTSPGRACWTWPPAPSAGGASRSARPGRPASRCRPRS